MSLLRQADAHLDLIVQAEAALAACTEALWTAIKQPARLRPPAQEWVCRPSRRPPESNPGAGAAKGQSCRHSTCHGDSAGDH